MIFGQHDENTLIQYEDIRSRAVKAALMADGHLGYVMPVGGVAAYDNQVSAVGVGFDIACGNCAIKTNIKIEDFTSHKVTVKDIESNLYYVTSDKKLNKLADQIAKVISFGIGRNNLADDAPVDHELFYDPAWNIVPNIGGYRDSLRQKARNQLGTVGSGNHYVDVFVDKEDGYLWVGVHFGSRGLGHTIASNFLALGQGGSWGDRGKEEEVLLNISEPLGSDYWAMMELAGRYAYAGREWVARKVVSFLEGEEIDMVHNHHNFAWKETHWIDGGKKEVIVVRKGATPAFPNQRGFVGGSMGDDAVILAGTGTFYPEENEFCEIDVKYGGPDGNSPQINVDALFSTVHGAGRVMSRTEAAGKWNKKKNIQKKKGKVTPEMMNKWLSEKGVILRGGGLDESPHAYRRLPDVLAAQGNTIGVLNTLRPLVVVMAGANEFDPYRD